MRVARMLLALLAAAATVAAAADAALARTIRASGPVRALAVTGFEDAYAAEYRTGCSEIRVWNTADRGVRRYASHCFVSTSTGSGVSQIAVAKGRALWVTYTGGNFREYSLWTKTRTSKVRKLAFETREVDLPPPLVVGNADEQALPYALGRAVIVLAPNGSRLLSWQAPAEVRSLSAQGARHTVVLADGRVYSLGADGTARLEATREARTLVGAAWDTTGLLVHVRGSLEAPGGRTLTVPAAARPEGCANGVYAYSAGRDLRLLRVRDGRDVRFAAVSSPALAGFDRLGIGYAVGRSVTFGSWTVVARALG